MNDNFMNWGFHPNRGNLNEPPYTATIIKCQYEDTADDFGYVVYYICPFDMDKEYSKLSELYTGVYSIEGFIVGCIASAWGYDNWEEVDGGGSQYDFSYHSFEITYYQPLNETLFNFLKDEINIYNIGYSVQRTISSINETFENI